MSISIFEAMSTLFIDSAQGWIEQVQMQYAPYLTDFLDPRQAYILEKSDSAINRFEFSIFLADMKRC